MLSSVCPALSENYVLHFTDNPSFKGGKLLPMDQIELTAYFYIAYELSMIFIKWVGGKNLNNNVS